MSTSSSTRCPDRRPSASRLDSVVTATNSAAWWARSWLTLPCTDRRATTSVYSASAASAPDARRLPGSPTPEYWPSTAPDRTWAVRTGSRSVRFDPEVLVRHRQEGPGRGSYRRRPARTGTEADAPAPPLTKLESHSPSAAWRWRRDARALPRPLDCTGLG